MTLDEIVAKVKAAQNTAETHAVWDEKEIVAFAKQVAGEAVIESARRQDIFGEYLTSLIDKEIFLATIAIRAHADKLATKLALAEKERDSWIKSAVQAKREKIAALCHEQWSGWMKYLFARCYFTRDGAPVIAKEDYQRWDRQTRTPFDKLGDGEKNSDRKEADRFIALISPTDTISASQGYCIMDLESGGVNYDRKLGDKSRPLAKIAEVEEKP